MNESEARICEECESAGDEEGEHADGASILISKNWQKNKEKTYLGLNAGRQVIFCRASPSFPARFVSWMCARYMLRECVRMLLFVASPIRRCRRAGGGGNRGHIQRKHEVREWDALKGSRSITIKRPALKSWQYGESAY